MWRRAIKPARARRLSSAKNGRCTATCSNLTDVKSSPIVMRLVDQIRSVGLDSLKVGNMTEQPKTLEEAAAYFRVSRRFFQDFLSNHPFYRVMGRRKLFFPDDIRRLTEALKRPCHSSSSRRGKANRP